MLRSRTQKVLSFLGGQNNFSIRKISEFAQISKSSVQRIVNAVKKRNCYPESYFWETPEGKDWLTLLVYGAIFHFGVRCGVGADMISKFFLLLHLEKHVGVSASSIKKMRSKIEESIIEFQEIHTACNIPEKPLKIVGGVDETFFKEMILVLMDLASGYLFFEEESRDRTYETWLKKTQAVVHKFNLDIQYFVSDRAKALVKLGEKGFGCPSIPDLFHSGNEMVKTFGSAFSRKISAFKKKIDKAVAALKLLQVQACENIDKIKKQQELIRNLKNEQAYIESGRNTYLSTLYDLSKAVHPFEIHTNCVQTSENVRKRLIATSEAVRLLQIEYDVNDNNSRLEKYGRQIDGIALLIDYWWLLVDESLAPCDINEECRIWLLEVFLPFVYWKKQVSKTKNPDLKTAYETAFHLARQQLEGHPFTPSQINNENWLSWAEWMVSNFQRTSSAVEGRNGCLSQIHHNGRGLSMKRLKALTVIHNYVLKRSDGTTAAERLFCRSFPDLFEWVVDNMGELPLSRKYKSTARANYLNLQIVPA